MTLDPAAAPLAERHRFPLCAPEPLEALCRAASLRDVRCEPLEIEMRFASFDDFWAPMLGGTAPLQRTWPRWTRRGSGSSPPSSVRQ